MRKSDSGDLSIDEKEQMYKDYRIFSMRAEQSLTEFETEFKSMVALINEQLGTPKTEQEQARDFMHKINQNIFREWKAQCVIEERKQLQTVECKEPRDKVTGYPQSLQEAISRAKVVERLHNMNIAKRNNNNWRKRTEDGNKEKGKPGVLTNFTNFSDGRQVIKWQRPKYSELIEMADDTLASAVGVDPCGFCLKLGIDKSKADHLFVFCTNNPKRKKEGSRANKQKRLMIMQPTLGSDEQDTTNLFQSLSDGDLLEYSRDEQHRFMISPHMPREKFVHRHICDRLEGIMDTGSSGNDIPSKVVDLLDCNTMQNPLSHIPINTQSHIESSVFAAQMVNVLNTQWQKRENQKRKFDAHRNFNQNSGRGRGFKGRSSQGRGHGGRFGKFNVFGSDS